MNSFKILKEAALLTGIIVAIQLFNEFSGYFSQIPDPTKLSNS